MSDRSLDAHSWPELADRASTTLLAVPLGATEQHGPHLPLGTDTIVATALGSGLAAVRDDVLVAPALAYGSSGEHAGFPGTLSIGGPVLTTVVVELVRSADAFAGVVLIGGHGGNLAAVTEAVGLLQGEGRRVLAWWPRVPGGDLHAGRTETALLLALAPSFVAVDRAEVGDTRAATAVLPELRRGGVAAVSPNGVLGDPTGASAEEGRVVFDAMLADLVAAVGAWTT